MEKVIRLTNRWSSYTPYFKNHLDCDAYLHVFNDHWCNVPWNKPQEVDLSEVPYKSLESMKKDPIERAEADLSWGFCLEKDKKCELTPAQKNSIADLIKKNTM